MLTKEQTEKFLKNKGLTCPNCNDGAPEMGTSYVLQSGVLSCEFYCFNCHGRWKSLYYLGGLFEFVKGDGNAN